MNLVGVLQNQVAFLEQTALVARQLLRDEVLAQLNKGLQSLIDVSHHAEQVTEPLVEKTLLLNNCWAFLGGLHKRAQLNALSS